MKNLDPKRARWIRLRMGLLSGVMGIAMGGFVSSAYRVQVEDGAAWREKAEMQRQRRLHVEPKRGTIYDRNGTPLAASVEVPSVSADVAEMLHGATSPAIEAETLHDAAARLAPALALDVNELYARLATKRRFLWVKRRVSADEATAIRTLTDPKQPRPIRGLTIEGEGHRYYPGRELAGSVLGFVAPDGQGKDGIELALDDELRGHVEDAKGLRDSAGHTLAEGAATDQEALDGHDVTLTLDEGIQHLAEQELDAAQKTYETKGASIVVLDPNSGEVLAIASTPGGYNPNDYGTSDIDSRRDRAVTDRFEPGSAMKVFTVAAALANGSLQPTESIFCEHGSYKLGNVTISDTHLNDWLTPTQILAKSSNIGALKIGLALGEPGLYAAFRRFGFGEPTGLPLPGEAAGVLRPRGRPWYEVETANASFGQGVSVTTMQLAMAFGAIANGGRLLEPILVRRITDSRGRVLREGVPHVRRETVPPQIARLMTEMLTAVTEEGGTAVEAAVPGFRVAGKTGTAQKADAATGKFSTDRFNASFTGIVPADRPRLVISVVLDEPMIGHVGGNLAGPVFRRVAEGALRYLGVQPSMAVTKADRERLEAQEDQTPAPKPTPVLTYADTARTASPMSIGPGEVRVPDAAGLGTRDALKMMATAGLVAEVEGTGHLARQSPQPGAAAAKGSVVRLVFEPSS